MMCDDLESTMVDLKAKGAEFKGDIQDHGYGLIVMLNVQCADDIQLYEPRHPVAHAL